ncbi:MAG: YdiU family protein [Myxococcales bacterium]|nr:YdiU family protein [Myxococcales bacterium]
MTPPPVFSFDNSYARLPDRLFARVRPTPVRWPRLWKLNDGLARELGLETSTLSQPEAARLFSGNELPAGAEPLALAYAGHQFGSFVPQLGDGRAILLGEVVGRDGKRRDIQLKGAGPTPFSRRGDGRAALGPVLREYVVSEAMAALGVPTTRALAAVTTGEWVARDKELPGAVITRVAASHLRVGTFQYFAVRRDTEALASLTTYALDRHFPEADRAAGEGLALLDAVIEAQANLVARWLGLGFVHGVMNTDNTAISGETLDYGPCAFLDEYHPQKKYSSIDHGGRYAFERQPDIALWNLGRLAESLSPLVSDDAERALAVAREHLARFQPRFQELHLAVLRSKLGLARAEDGDRALAADLFGLLASSEVDFTLFFRRLCDAAEDERADHRVAALFREPESFAGWARAWRARLHREDERPDARAAAMRRQNPAFIPRNHRIEEMIHAAITKADRGPFEALLRTLSRPYDDQPGAEHLAEPPRAHERVTQTFCGT